MIDREKVIRGLECCAASCRNDCPYFDITIDCQGVLCRDALELLKAQEPVEPKRETSLRYGQIWKCGECGTWFVVQKQKFCYECGRAMKWDGI